MKMATGEVIGAEELGGAQIHANTTGLADQIATDESVLFLLCERHSADMIQDLMLSRKLVSGSALCHFH